MAVKSHGTITKTKFDTWKVWFYFRDDNGNRIRRSKTFEKKQEAKAALAAHVTAMEKNTAVLPDSNTLSEWLSFWLEQFKSSKIEETTLYG